MTKPQPPLSVSLCYVIKACCANYAERGVNITPDECTLPTLRMGHGFCHVPRSVSRLCQESAKQTASPVTTSSSSMQRAGLSAPLGTTHLALAQINNVWLRTDAPASPGRRTCQSGWGTVSKCSQKENGRQWEARLSVLIYAGRLSVSLRCWVWFVVIDATL